MKRHLLVVRVSLFLVAGSVCAQSVGLDAQIPFDFVLGNTTSQAGKYTIDPIGMGESTILLRSAGLKQAILVRPAYAPQRRRNMKANSDSRCTATTNFLWQVWTQGYDAGRELPVNLRKLQGANLAQPYPVVILAHSWPSAAGLFGDSGGRHD